MNNILVDNMPAVNLVLMIACWLTVGRYAHRAGLYRILAGWLSASIFAAVATLAVWMICPDGGRVLLALAGK
jgi:hypothetical protein